MYKSFEISNFKGISNLKLDNLKAINILVGRNNVGKTSILDAIYWLTTFGQNKVMQIKNDTTNLQFYFNNFNLDHSIKFTGVTYENLISYELELKYNYNELNEDLSNCSFNYIKTSGELKFISQGLCTDKNITINSNPIKNYSNIKYLNPNNLNNLNVNLFKALDNSNLKIVIDILQAQDSNIKNISLIDNEIVVDIGLIYSIPINCLSSATVKLFNLVLELLTIENGVILIDNVNECFHYTMLKIIWRLLFYASDNNNLQIFLVSNSDEFIRAYNVVLQEKFEKNKDIYTDLENVPACMIRIENKKSIYRAVYYDPELIKAVFNSNVEYR